ncbi:MAG: DUF2332 domain-containing protein [Caulobacter sp.]|nr:DUF2332 domain-containing protein [Caulobacter sp.]
MDATNQALRWQADQCDALGSPFSGTLLRAAADGELGPLDDLFAAWAGREPASHIRDATPLRLLGALHHLTLTGAAPVLAGLYPDQAPGTDWTALIPAARSALETHRAQVADFMTSPPQTNEVGRSLCLAPGFLIIAARTGLPLSLQEIGASAGLNLRWDRYGYDLGGRRWGDAASPVQLSANWRGAAPARTPPVTVAARAACDQAPLDVNDEATALRLQSYVWADQPARLARLRGAIAIARTTPADLVKADAAVWTESRLAPVEGVASVLFHSVMWQYMPQATQNAVSAAIDAAASAATASAPFAWLRMEPDLSREGFPMAVRLTLWPDGQTLHLANVHPHGAWVDWLGDRAPAP